MPKQVNGKRPGPGRPPREIDFAKALEFAGMGMDHKEICKSLGIGMSVWMRYLREGDHREQVQIRRSKGIADVLMELKRHVVENGKTSAASYLLARLERRIKLAD